MGFIQTHLSGTGIGDLLDVLVMPVSKSTSPHPAIEDRWDREARSRFSHDREDASAGYYSVFLQDQDIQAELTASPRVGMHRYTFPPAPTAAIYLDLGYAMNWDTPVRSRIRIINDTLVTGYRFSEGWARDERIHFAMAFSQPFLRAQIADSTWTPASSLRGLQGRGGSATGKALRALFSFDSTTAGERDPP